MSNQNTKKVIIVGTGFVGTAIAYSIVNQGITEELVLIDLDSAKAEGEAADLRCYSGGKFDAKRTRQLFSVLSEMDVDQLLYEKDSQGSIWVHVSYKSPKENRHDVRDNYYAG